MNILRSIYLFSGIIWLLAAVIPCHARQRDTLSSSHIEFIENKKQWPENVVFKAKLNSGAIFIEKNAITYVILNGKQLEEFYHAKKNPPLIADGLIDAAAYKMNIVGSNPSARVRGNSPFSHYYNYFLGDDPDKWATKVNLYRYVSYEDIYPGIDLVLSEHDHHFKYEFIVDPYIDPNTIQLHYSGIKSLSIANQNLVVSTFAGEILELRPWAYQIYPDGDTVDVSCRYHIEKKTVKFILGNYRKDIPLTIDPTLVFSTYSGSTADNWGYTATYDSEGNAYGGGIAFDIGYPTDSAYQVNFAGGICDIVITKFNVTGNDILFSTYLGGGEVDIPNSLIVNENDELYVLGTTSSADFPTTPEAYSRTFKGGTSYTLTGALHFTSGSDITVTKFNLSGTRLLASTYIGGSGNDGLNTAPNLKVNYADEARGEIIIDKQSNVYITSSTHSLNFPVTPDAFQPQYGGGNQDGCIIKFNHNLSNVIWASFLGGTGNDAAYSIALASDNTIYVCGGTSSSDFPVTPGAFQTQLGGGAVTSNTDGFITHINEFGTRIMHSTFLGSDSPDQTYLIKNNKSNYPHVFGQTWASGSFWIRNAGWYVPGGGQFLSKLTPSLDQIVWSTAFGTGNGTPDISPTALLVDLCSNIYMSGWGSGRINPFGGTAGLPVTADAFQHTTDNNDYYFICLNDDATSLMYASYFGSPNSDDHVDGGTSRFDNKGRIYQAVCAGCGGDQYFPTTPGAWSNTNGSHNCNLAVIKMDFNLPAVVADFSIPNTVCAPYVMAFHNNSQVIGQNYSFHWDFGDGTVSTEENPTHSYTISGIYTIRLIVTNPSSCNYSDTMTRNLLVLANSTTRMDTLYVCAGESVQIGFPPSADDNVTYRWLPSAGLNNPMISNPVATPDRSTEYILYMENGVCSDTIIQYIHVIDIDLTLKNDTVICQGGRIVLSPESYSPEIESFVWSDSPSFATILNTDTTRPEVTVSPNQNTEYYLRVRKGRCILIKSIRVTVSFVGLASPPPYTLCFNQPIEIEIISNCPDCNYYWSPENLIITGNGTAVIRVNPPSDTVFTVIAVNRYGCMDTGSVQVIKQTGTFPEEIVAWAKPNSIIQGDTTTLYSTVFQDNGYTYQWSPSMELSSPLSPQTTAKPSRTTIYTVVVTDSFGCSKSDTAVVSVEKVKCGEPLIFVPNAFTPNQDSKNDILYVRGDYMEEIYFVIYNRWGEKVFETRLQEEGWDGTYKNKPCPPGVYDYYLKAICIGKEEYIKKGNITLIR